jgi:hypothetical protein
LSLSKLPAAASILVAFALSLPEASAESLHVEGEIASASFRDRDGDGLAEAWVAYFGDGRRSLAIFRGAPRYEPKPFVVLPVDDAAVLHAVGDFDPAPGLELLYVSRSSVVIRSPSLGGGGDSAPRRVLTGELFFTTASRQAFPAWQPSKRVDIDLDGLEDLCLPGKDGPWICLQRRPTATAAEGPSDGGSTSARWAEFQLPLSPQALRGSREERIRDALEEIFQSGAAEARETRRDWSSAFAHIEDFDGDGRPDVIVKAPGPKLEVFRQLPAGGFPTKPDLSVEAPWAKDASSLVFVDLDRDRHLDLVVTQTILKELLTEVRCFIQEPGAADLGLATPRQTLRIQGLFRHPVVADADRDGFQDLLVSAWRVDLLEAWKGSAVEELEVSHEADRGRGESAPFERRPAFQRKFLLRTKSLEEGPPRAALHAGHDLTGDGRPDLLFIDNGQALRLWRGLPGAGIRFEEDAAYRRKIEVPRDLELLDLDGKPGDEAVLRYSSRLAIERIAP